MRDRGFGPRSLILCIPTRRTSGTPQRSRCRLFTPREALRIAPRLLWGQNSWNSIERVRVRFRFMYRQLLQKRRTRKYFFSVPPMIQTKNRRLWGGGRGRLVSATPVPTSTCAPPRPRHKLTQREFTRDFHRPGHFSRVGSGQGDPTRKTNRSFHI